MTENNNTNQDPSVALINIEDELQVSYLDYAMSVITGRALPDARDGFKPVHRRVIYSMYLDKHTPDKEFVKSAEIVGKVMGTFHPHGDAAIYDTLVRMAQDFSLRYPLVQGQGNFGGRGDESAAAMRYTEAKMQHISQDLVADIDKGTVNFVPNYSNKTVEPLVLPTRVPNLLINGSSGIAVGMATNIPSHNLTEIINGVLALIDNPEISVAELMQYIPGPDFPTKSTIGGTAGIRQAYETGRGSIILSALYHIRQEARSNVIVITDLPYQVNYNKVVDQITSLAKESREQKDRRDKNLEAITEILNLTKQNIKIEVHVNQSVDPHAVMNVLFARTDLRKSFGINMIALHEGRPKTFSLKGLLEVFITFRREVITRRSLFDLRKHRARIHILEGLAVALSNLDHIIALIRSSSSTAEAVEKIMLQNWSYEKLQQLLSSIAGGDTNLSSITRPEDLEEGFGIIDNSYYFSKVQATAILEMPLSRLTNLGITSINNEYAELVRIVKELIDILQHDYRLTQVLKDELIEIKEKYQSKHYNFDQRNCEITNDNLDLDDLSFITKEDVVITLTSHNYVKYQQLTEYQHQHRGGKGKSFSRNMKKDDSVQEVIIASTHDELLAFSNFGRVFRIPVHILPFETKNGRGKPILHFIELFDGERINNFIVLTDEHKEKAEQLSLLITTKLGRIKKTKLSAFLKTRTNRRGLKAIRLLEINNDDNYVENEDDVSEEIFISDNSDQVVSVSIINTGDIAYLFSKHGRCSVFNTDLIRPQSRTGSGVRGMKINADNGDQIISTIVPRDESPILTVLNSAIGKRTKLELFPEKKGRNSIGVISHKISEKEIIVGAIQAGENDHVILISEQGVTVRFAAASVSQVGRSSRGVKLFNLAPNDRLIGVERVIDGALDETAEIAKIDGEDLGEIIDGDN